jgi:hypothetical protein
MNNDLKNMLKEVVVDELEVLSQSFLDRQRNTTETSVRIVGSGITGEIRTGHI